MLILQQNFFHKLKLIVNLVATWFCKNRSLIVIVNVKFTISRIWTFCEICKIKLPAKLFCFTEEHAFSPKWYNCSSNWQVHWPFFHKLHPRHFLHCTSFNFNASYIKKDKELWQFLLICISQQFTDYVPLSGIRGISFFFLGGGKGWGQSHFVWNAFSQYKFSF